MVLLCHQTCITFKCECGTVWRCIKNEIQAEKNKKKKKKKSNAYCFDGHHGQIDNVYG